MLLGIHFFEDLPPRGSNAVYVPVTVIRREFRSIGDARSCGRTHANDEGYGHFVIQKVSGAEVERWSKQNGAWKAVWTAIDQG